MPNANRFYPLRGHSYQTNENQISKIYPSRCLCQFSQSSRIANPSICMVPKYSDQGSLLTPILCSDSRFLSISYFTCPFHQQSHSYTPRAAPCITTQAGRKILIPNNHNGLLKLSWPSKIEIVITIQKPGVPELLRGRAGASRGRRLGKHCEA